MVIMIGAMKTMMIWVQNLHLGEAGESLLEILP